MQKLSIVITFLSICLWILSCKKDYTCVCTNPTGSNHDFYNILKENKKTAEQKCKDYYYTTYANVPTNKISCEINTK